MTDTDPMDLDGDRPLNKAERDHLRRIMRDDDRTSWALKKMRVVVPMVVAIVVAAWQAWDWLAKHVRVTP